MASVLHKKTGQGLEKSDEALFIAFKHTVVPSWVLFRFEESLLMGISRFLSEIGENFLQRGC
jgi:hypothetical protein